MGSCNLLSNHLIGFLHLCESYSGTTLVIAFVIVRILARRDLLARSESNFCALPAVFSQCAVHEIYLYRPYK